jgi:hypothetical protein
MTELASSPTIEIVRPLPGVTPGSEPLPALALKSMLTVAMSAAETDIRTVATPLGALATVLAVGHLSWKVIPALVSAWVVVFPEPQERSGRERMIARSRRREDFVMGFLRVET